MTFTENWERDGENTEDFKMDQHICEPQTIPLLNRSYKNLQSLL